MVGHIHLDDSPCDRTTKEIPLLLPHCSHFSCFPILENDCKGKLAQ